jgi:hypothetical protein
VENKKSIGQAIDQIVEALEGLEPNLREVALQAASTSLGIQIPPRKVGGDIVSGIEEHVYGSETDKNSPVDIKILRQNKDPKSGIEMAVLIGYYLKELAPQDERKEQISADDLDKYFRQAAYPLPKMDMVLPNAKQAGYFDLAGRGAYKLNSVGYNLAAHALPRSSAEKFGGSLSRRPKAKNSQRTSPKTK